MDCYFHMVQGMSFSLPIQVGKAVKEEFREVPFWREGMTSKEYDKEREYCAKNFTNLVMESQYVPLWKQGVDRSK